MKDNIMIAPSIKKNAIFNVLRTLMTLLFPLITFPYASRILLPEGIGKVSFARSFVDYFIIIATLGITTYGIRETSKVRDNKEKLSKITKEILAINLVSTGIAYLLLFIAIFTVPQLSTYRSLLIIISAKILFIALGLEWLYGGMEDYRYITLRAFLFQILSVILLFAFVHTPADYLKYASIAVISNVGSNICNLIHSRKYINFFTVSNLDFKKHLKPIFILFSMAAIANVYAALDVTMLGFLCGDWEVGIYTSAIKINRIVIQVVISIGAVVLPRLAYFVKKEDKNHFKELVYKNFDMFFLLSVPCAIGLCLIGETVILAFSGEKFIAAVPIMRIMNPLIIIIGIGSVMGTQTFVPLGKEKLVLYALITGVLANLLLNIILIPRYKIWGAAIATLVSESLLSGVLLFWGKEIIEVNKVWNFFEVYLFNSIIMALFVYICLLLIPGLWFSSIIAIFIGIFIYGALLIIEKNHFVMDMFRLIKKRY